MRTEVVRRQELTANTRTIQIMNVKFKVTRAFFDTEAVLKAIGKERVKRLSKAGAFVRRSAKGLIRSGKKSSQPGSPPHSHTGKLKNNIFFAYDGPSDSVVIGPEKTNQVFFDGDGKPASGTVPETLEFGGSIKILEVFLPSQNKWVRADLRSKRRLAGRKTRLRRVNIEARPFMGPALAKEVDKFPDLWAGVIT